MEAEEELEEIRVEEDAHQPEKLEEVGNEKNKINKKIRTY